jgi:hypothetical protein
MKRLLSLLAVILVASTGLLVLTPAKAQDGDKYPLARAITAAVVDVAVNLTGKTEAELLQAILSGDSVAEILAQSNVDLATFKANVSTEVIATLNQAVTDGALTQAQADTFIGNLDALIDRVLEGGKLGENARERLQGGAKILRTATEGIAQALNMTLQDLARTLATGKTLAELIAEKGLDTATIKAAMRDAVTTDLSEAVASGKLTQDQADQVLNSLDETLDKIISGELQMRRGRDDQAGQNLVTRRLNTRVVGVLLAETAKAVDLTQREVLAKLREGQSFSAIASAANADAAAIISSSKTALSEAVKRLITRNQISQTDADTFLAGLDALLETAFNSTNPLGDKKAK